MISIQLTENGRTGQFTASTALDTAGTLSYAFTGPGKMVVDSMEISSEFGATGVAYALLDALHQYAHQGNYYINFRCPKARSLNDQQIEQEMRKLLLTDAAAA